jgi:hypothetical protein
MRCNQASRTAGESAVAGGTSSAGSSSLGERASAAAPAIAARAASLVDVCVCAAPGAGEAGVAAARLAGAADPNACGARSPIGGAGDGDALLAAAGCAGTSKTIGGSAGSRAIPCISVRMGSCGAEAISRVSAAGAALASAESAAAGGSAWVMAVVGAGTAVDRIGDAVGASDG